MEERYLLLVHLLAKACNFTKNDTPPSVFFRFFLKNGQMVPNRKKASNLMNDAEINVANSSIH